MIWTIISIILISLVKIVVTCLPTGPVEWLLRKFDVHSTITSEDTIVTLNGKRLEGSEKIQVIDSFNRAIFFEKHYIFPGTEDLFLHPENGGTPLIIDSKRGKKDIRLFIFRYDDRIEIIKQYKKKVFAYSLLSDHLQKLTA